MTNDPFFASCRDWTWNACIGDQGLEEYYVNGYIDAAIELVDAIFDKKLHNKRDTLVLPILYNARHAIELALKMGIRELKNMGVLDNAPPKNHDILAHWSHLNNANLGDERLKYIVAEIRPFVHSLAKIDEDGQELRYHQTRNGARSLKGRSVINLAVVREGLKSLCDVLNSLKHRIDSLESERRGNFFNPDLSRNDLVQIASCLPDRNDWNTAEFGAIKVSIMERYGIGARKFSTALKMIENNRETKGLIGIETDLRFLSDKKASLLTNKHFDFWPPPTEGSGMRFITAAEIDFESMKQDSERRADFFQELLSQISLQEIADVSVAFYIGHSHTMPELYEMLLEKELQKLKTRKLAETAFVHVFQKANFRRDFVGGLDKLGRIVLAKELRIRTHRQCFDRCFST